MYLAANLAVWLGRGVDIHVPLTVTYLVELRLRQIKAIDLRGAVPLAKEFNGIDVSKIVYDRTILGAVSRPMNVGRRRWARKRSKGQSDSDLASSAYDQSKPAAIC